MLGKDINYLILRGNVADVNKKYFAPVVDRVGAGPHRSAWINARECWALDKDKWKGSL